MNNGKTKANIAIASMMTQMFLRQPALPTWMPDPNGDLPALPRWGGGFKHYKHPTRRLHTESKVRRKMAARSNQINRRNCAHWKH